MQVTDVQELARLEVALMERRADILQRADAARRELESTTDFVGKLRAASRLANILLESEALIAEINQTALAVDEALAALEQRKKSRGN